MLLSEICDAVVGTAIAAVCGLIGVVVTAVFGYLTQRLVLQAKSGATDKPPGAADRKLKNWNRGRTVALVLLSGTMAALGGSLVKQTNRALGSDVLRARAAEVAKDEVHALPGILPIGSIIAWHKNPGGHEKPDKPEAMADKPPTGWQECDGSTIPSDSPLRRWGATTTPLLNEGAGFEDGKPVRGRFLRGGLVSGQKQDDAFKAHSHPTAHKGYSFMDVGIGANGDIARTGNGDFPLSPRTGDEGIADETRPKNMSVVWIIRVK